MLKVKGGDVLDATSEDKFLYAELRDVDWLHSWPANLEVSSGSPGKPPMVGSPNLLARWPS